MGYKKLFAYLFTAIFAAVAVFCGWKATAWDGSVGISVVISAEEGEEEIRCWKSEAGEYYIFLPGYAELSEARLHTNTRSPVYIDGRRLTDGMSCEGFALKDAHDLAYAADGERQHFTLKFVQSGNVPAMYIDVASGSMAHIHEVKGNEEPGTLRLYTAEGTLDFSGNLDSIKGRGNDSWSKEKKPYSLKLGTEADLLGMGSAQRWVLLSNYNDPTHIRNKVVYDLAGTLGMPYTPGCTWVDLYLNGEYAGLYLLSERNEVHPQRVDVAEEESFLVSMEPVGRLAGQEYPYVTTGSNMAFRVRSSAFSAETMTTILQTVDNAIHAEDGIDPVTGTHWRELIDLDSWVRKYLIEEIFGNLDANAASQFYYYVGDGTEGTLYAGPVWDYDLSMGSHMVWQTQATDAFFAASPHIWSEDDHPWFYAMTRQEEFRSRAMELYEKEFRPRLAALLETGLADYAGRITQAAAMNQIRCASEDFGEHMQRVRDYMEKRLEFLDSFWMEQEAYCIVTINIRTGANIGCYAVRPGETLQQFPEDWVTWQGDNYGWYTVDTEEPFDITQPIYEDTDIYLKWFPEEAVVSDSMPSEETAEEPLSLLRLAPAMVFAVMLIIVCTVGLRRSRRSREKEPAYN